MLKVCHLLFILSFLLPTSLLAEEGVVAPKVFTIRVEGVINVGATKYIERAIRHSEKHQGKLLVIELDTPGGLLQETRKIVQAMNKSKVPVAVYVSPSGASATSAGTIITMSAHIAAMAPGTNIGAAHPVSGQGQDIKGAMGEKAENDTVAFIKAQAQQHGRNALWAEKAIRQSVAVTSDEALKLKVVDFVVSDTKELILQSSKKVDAVGIPIVHLEPTSAERVLSFLGHPNVSYMLMMLGGLGVYVEVQSPGLIFPGAIGAICLMLSFISMSTLPVNYGAVGLLFLGLVLFVLEAFVTSFGALTIGGAISILLGALFLIDRSTGDLAVSLSLVIPTILAIGGITFVMGWLILKSRKAVYVGNTSFMGFEGVVESLDESGHSGKCHIRGETWDFKLTNPQQKVQKGDSVKVLDQKHFTLFVEKVTKE